MATACPEAGPRDIYVYAAVQGNSTAPQECSAPAHGELRNSKRTAHIVAAVVFATVAVVILVAAWCGGSDAVGGRGEHQLRQLPNNPYFHVKQEDATWVQGAEFDSQAPKMDVDVEYRTDGGWGTNFDHIPDPEMCAAMCQGVPKCKAYTWVKDAGLPGCPSQCWLKGSVGVKVPKAGLVSGVPPPRKELPAVPRKRGGATIWCFALMVPGGTEHALLKWQYENKASIFGCDGTAVYSNRAIPVAGDVVTRVINSTLKCDYGGDSQSALNAWIFIACWYKVIQDADYKNYDWVVKCDPDAVFFPDRLSLLLENHEGAGYVNNCKYGMHGPIEVFSSRAIDALARDYKASWDGKAPKRCVTVQQFGQWGEDMFIDQCLGKVLQVKPRPTDSKLMCESHCDCPTWYWCNEGHDIVSYHPFKTVDAYKNCVANAIAGERVA